MNMKRLGMVAAGWLVLAAVALAQMEMPKPGPEHKKLDIFAGSWTLDGDVKPGPMGPGGKMTETFKCQWMEGGFFLVCHTDFKGATGSGVGTYYMGYSADDKAYTYREFNSWGDFTDAKGSVNGDTWTWLTGATTKGRFTMKIISPTSYNFSYETSPDGAKWTLVMDGKATKGK
jgi:hypothetical protein